MVGTKSEPVEEDIVGGDEAVKLYRKRPIPGC